MSIIKHATGLLYVPVVLQNSPLNPHQDALIIMRSCSSVEKLSVEFTTDLAESELASRFVFRNFQFMTKDPVERSQQLRNDLLNFYKSDGLMLIGGVQEKNRGH